MHQKNRRSRSHADPLLPYVNCRPVLECHIYDDLLDVVMVCLGPKKYKELTGLLDMLNLVFKDNDLTAAEKRERLANDYHIEITPELEKGVADMCNLSAGIEKNAREEERQRVLAETEECAKDLIRDRMDLTLVEKYTHLSLPRIKDLAHGLEIYYVEKDLLQQPPRYLQHPQTFVY